MILTMPEGSPLHERTSALNKSFLWKDWSGYAAPCAYTAHSEREYFAIRSSAAMLDVSPLQKMDVRGADGARLLARVFTRDITQLGVGRVTYGALVNEEGWIVDDGTIARLGETHWRVSTSEPCAAWVGSQGRGLDVQVEDISRNLAVLAVQGPRARAICDAVTDIDLTKMRFFRVQEGQVGGVPGWVSRTGYTGDLGYELWVAADKGPALWDALMDAGAPHGLEPCGLDALDVARIEAGFVLQGVDYVSARFAPSEWHKLSPVEAGLGFTVDTEREVELLGMARIRRHLEGDRRWTFVRLLYDIPAIEALHDRIGLPPHFAPQACRETVPLFAPGGKQVGRVTSSTWSPTTKGQLALGSVQKGFGEPGAKLQVEYTVRGERHKIPCVVQEKPFFTPKRTRRTPGLRRSK